MAYPQSCLLRRIFARPTHSSRDRKTYGGCAEGLCVFNCLGEGLLRTGQRIELPVGAPPLRGGAYLDCRPGAVIAVAPIGGRPPRFSFVTIGAFVTIVG